MYAKKLLQNPEPILRQILNQKAVKITREARSMHATPEAYNFFQRFSDDDIISKIKEVLPKMSPFYFLYFTHRSEDGRPNGITRLSLTVSAIGVMAVYSEMSFAFDSNTNSIFQAKITLTQEDLPLNRIGFNYLIEVSVFSY